MTPERLQEAVEYLLKRAAVGTFTDGKGPIPVRQVIRDLQAETACLEIENVRLKSELDAAVSRAEWQLDQNNKLREYMATDKMEFDRMKAALEELHQNRPGCCYRDCNPAAFYKSCCVNGEECECKSCIAHRGLFGGGK